jgi:hypothetical protein
MADSLGRRPFDNFRVAITDPYYFIGRDKLLEAICWSPFQVRVLLGGRRLGKTSTLRAIEWNLLEANPGRPRTAFPVFMSLQLERPTGLDHLLYLLIARLREAVDRWQQIQYAPPEQMYQGFLVAETDREASRAFLAGLGAGVDVLAPEREGRLSPDRFRRGLLETYAELRRWGGALV